MSWDDLLLPNPLDAVLRGDVTLNKDFVGLGEPSCEFLLSTVLIQQT